MTSMKPSEDSSNSAQQQALTSSNATSVMLKIQGIEHVPSFKNSKEIVPGRAGRRAMLITKPERQVWMEKAIVSFTYQLRCLFLTKGIATMTEPIPLSKIVSLLPLDDSRKWIPSHSVSTRLVPKGSEGAVITITKL